MFREKIGSKLTPSSALWQQRGWPLSEPETELLHQFRWRMIGRMKRRAIFVLMLMFAAAPLPMRAGHCPTEKTKLKVSRKILVQQQKAEADGHQHWRSNAKFVAGVGVMRAYPSIRPTDERHFTSRLINRSKMKAEFLFTDPAHKDSYRVTVQRFHLRMPNSHKLITTVWWTTEVIRTGCSGPSSRENQSR